MQSVYPTLTSEFSIFHSAQFDFCKPVESARILPERRQKRKDRDTTFYLRGPRANWVTSEASRNIEGSLGVLLWKNVRPRSSNRLKQC